MFERILVCLDGSEIARQILPYAAVQASHFDSEVHLLNVLEKRGKESEGRPPEDFDAPIYLENAALSLREAGIGFSCVTTEGEVGEAIVAYAERHGIGLIAMATHGRSGLRRVVLGSVADFVVRNSGLPALMIRPRETHEQVPAEAQPFRRIMACLDGSELAEQIMPYAVEEAVRFGASIVLFRVVPEPVAYSPGIPGAEPAPVQTDRMVEEAKAGLDRAADYVDSLATPLREMGVQAETETMIGRAGEAIVNYADENRINLIAMATHGRGGVQRAVFGSVADYVLRQTGLPVLLLRPSEGQGQSAG